MKIKLVELAFLCQLFLLYRKYQPKTTKMSLLKKEKPQSGMYNLN